MHAGMDDHYATLGVARNATQEDIVRAYRKLAMQWHPDRNFGNEAVAEIRFKAIKKAYDVLSDTQCRNQHDAEHDYGFSFDDAVREQAARYRSQHAYRGPPPEPGADVECTAEVPPDVAINGGEMEVAFTVLDTCAECDGDGDLEGQFDCPICDGDGENYYGYSCRKCGGCGWVDEIKCEACKGKGKTKRSKKLGAIFPAGMHNGQRIRFRNAGGQGLNGGPAGDVYCTVKIKSNAQYKVSGLNITRELKVDYITATLGGSVNVDFFGKAYPVDIPAACRAGRTLTLDIDGLKNPKTGETGRLKCRVVLEMPEGVRQLKKEHKEILRSMFEAAAARSRK
jgi:molecular chaperone DnaJ